MRGIFCFLSLNTSRFSELTPVRSQTEEPRFATLEAGDTECGIDVIVVYCCCHREPLTPVFLLRAGDEAQVLLDPLVLPLRESIGLWVERRRQVLFCANFLCKGASEMRGKARISIRDDFQR